MVDIPASVAQPRDVLTGLEADRDPVLVQAGDRLAFGSAVFVIRADQREGGPPSPDRAGPASG